MNAETHYQDKIHALAGRFRLRSFPLIRACLAEFCGTAILVMFGCGVTAQVYLGNNEGNNFGSFLSISLGWGMAVMFGVLFAGSSGSGHVNPALTLAFAIIGKIPFKLVIFYTLSQLLGAFAGSLAIFGVYREKLFEIAAQTDGQQLLVNTTGSIFVTGPSASHVTCLLDQIMATSLLSAGILTIVDNKGWKIPGHLQPIYVGLLLFMLVASFALNAGCALNPARDLGPRLMLLICGWGSEAFITGGYFFWIPIIGPYLGAIFGAFLYEVTLGMHFDLAGRNEDPMIRRNEKTNGETEDTSVMRLLA